MLHIKSLIEQDWKRDVQKEVAFGQLSFVISGYPEILEHLSQIAILESTVANLFHKLSQHICILIAKGVK